MLYHSRFLLPPGQRLEPLWAPIRHKLASALSAWHPSDSSAKLMIQPWLRVFSVGHAEAFLAKNVVPKLAQCLNELIINPANQSMGKCMYILINRIARPNHSRE